jgi:hypothetical protein
MPPVFVTYKNIQSYVKVKVRLRWRHPFNNTAVVIGVDTIIQAHGGTNANEVRGVNYSSSAEYHGYSDITFGTECWRCPVRICAGKPTSLKFSWVFSSYTDITEVVYET